MSEEPYLYLTTTGRHTGQPREAELWFTRRGDAYYVIAEALTNVAKHAHASRATVTVSGENGSLALSVLDDGVGGADAALGSGLRGLSDRVQTLGGTFEVESDPGRGTEVKAWIPSA